ncbi:MAG: SRPBCC family protein [Gammaproteobacteria bacterium]|jgi:uncharacterized protein|nr:SRPBCC family protein [Gammaproteobacteria bacterium]MBT7371202.1 SRPBCC family protein [Gammaproteobacteria bacterium]
MAIELSEVFEIATGIDPVWEFLLVPAGLAECMPGTSLTGEPEPGRYEGQVALRLGAISVRYKGTLWYEEVEAGDHKVVLAVQATEQGGGGVRGSIYVELESLADNETRARVNSSFDLTGRLVQVGRGMIEGVAARIIGEFIANVKTELEAEKQSAEAGSAQDAEAAVDNVDDEIRVGSLVWHVLWDRIRHFFGRLMGRDKK